MRLSPIALATLLLPSAAWAGPPFMTDDPEPAETGHWEIYAPLFEAEGSGEDFEGALAAEVNYGAAKDLQLSLALPAAYTHDARGWHWAAGDVEASVKYRFVNDEKAGLQIATFPGVTLPTAGKGMGVGKVTALLPVWAQKDFGPWSLFGGGGYAINPGAGNSDYWTGGVALTRTFGERLQLGVEADRQGADTVGGSAATSLGVGAIYDLPGPYRLLASGGPTFEDHGGHGFHSFVALGLDF
jgi:hypothetical protein